MGQHIELAPDHHQEEVAPNALGEYELPPQAFDSDLGDIDDYSLNPPCPPTTGNTIIYYDPDFQMKFRATVLKTHPKCLKRYPEWYNVRLCQYTDNKGRLMHRSLHFPRTRWKYVDAIGSPESEPELMEWKSLTKPRQPQISPPPQESLRLPSKPDPQISIIGSPQFTARTHTPPLNARRSLIPVLDFLALEQDSHEGGPSGNQM